MWKARPDPGRFLRETTGGSDSARNKAVRIKAQSRNLPSDPLSVSPIEDGPSCTILNIGTENPGSMWWSHSGVDVSRHCCKTERMIPTGNLRLMLEILWWYPQPLDAVGSTLGTNGTWFPLGRTRRLVPGGEDAAPGSQWGGHGAWFPVGRTRRLVPSGENTLPGSRWGGHGAWFPVGRMRRLVPSGEDTVPGSRWEDTAPGSQWGGCGAWFLVGRMRCLVPGGENTAPGSRWGGHGAWFLVGRTRRLVPGGEDTPPGSRWGGHGAWFPNRTHPSPGRGALCAPRVKPSLQQIRLRIQRRNCLLREEKMTAIHPTWKHCHVSAGGSRGGRCVCVGGGNGRTPLDKNNVENTCSAEPDQDGVGVRTPCLGSATNLTLTGAFLHVKFSTEVRSPPRPP